MIALGQLLIARIVLRYIPQAFKQREFNKRVHKLKTDKKQREQKQ